MSQIDLDYFLRRERQHRDLADACEDAPGRHLHIRFAEGYAERVRVLRAERDPS